ncbi:hypothetical protein ACFPRL_31760 [Pseudoclavibacter helvolus]
MEHGARILFAFRRTPASWEAAALAELRRVFEPAFRDNLDAWEHMPRGHGWSECVRVSARQIDRAIDLILKGTQAYADAEAEDGEAVILPRSAGDGGADGDAVLRDRVDGVGGRSRAGGGAASSDAAGDVVGRRRRVAGADRGGHVVPRRVRVPAVVGGRGRSFVVPDRPGSVGHGGSPQSVDVPGAPVREFVREFIRESCRESWLRGEGERAGRVRERERAGAREREAPTRALLSSSPRWGRVRLQALRHCSLEEPPMGVAPPRRERQLAPGGAS